MRGIGRFRVREVLPTAQPYMVAQVETGLADRPPPDVPPLHNAALSAQLEKVGATAPPHCSSRPLRRLMHLTEPFCAPHRTPGRRSSTTYISCTSLSRPSSCASRRLSRFPQKRYLAPYLAF